MPHSTDSPEHRRREGEAGEEALPDAPAEPEPTAGDAVVKDEPAPSSPPAPNVEALNLNETKDGPSRDASEQKECRPADAEDLFAGDESLDDADLLSAEANALNTAAAAAPSDPAVMAAFYQRIFPFRLLFQWLNHSPVPSTHFTHREFAFTLQNEAYVRYLSFGTADLFKREVLRLNPSRFEIGPVYTANPRDRKSLRKAAFKPLAKEFVIDIDLTDYDDVRTCCDKANICHVCWRFVTVAIGCIGAALREDFGFKHVLWVYSGRRGAHAWVCDKRAREMDDERRRAVAAYLEVRRGGAQAGKKVNVRRPLHPHVARSLDALKDRFVGNILRDQDPWRSAEDAERLLALLPDRPLNDALRRKWGSAPGRSSVLKWADIDKVAETGVSKSLDVKALREAKQDVVLECMYPRLDVEVSKKLNHLLKSPFVVHPKTGRVCVPIEVGAGREEEFDPLGVPTVGELLADIDAWKGGEEGAERGEGKIEDWEKTRVKPYVEVFRRFVNTLIREETTAVKRERGEDAMEF